MDGSLPARPPSVDDLVECARRHGLVAPGELVTATACEGGVSSFVIRLDRPGRAGLIVKQALSKLRVRDDWFSSPVRIHREALALRWLERLAPPDTVPCLRFEDPDLHVIGMDEVPRPHATWKSLLMEAPPRPLHVEPAADLLASIHLRAAERHTELAGAFEDRSFFVTLRLDPYYRTAAGRTPDAAPFLQRLIDDTLDHAVTLVHGDYSPKNILIHHDRLYLIDHEVAHWGDPAFDVGFALTHLLSKAHHLPAFRAPLIEAARGFAERYLSRVAGASLGEDLAGRCGRHTLGCLLARIDGRSPLEYLTDAERALQRRIVLGLMGRQPSHVMTVVHQFGGALECS